MNKFKLIKIIIILVILIIGFICYARFIATKGLIIKEYAIKTDKLPEDYDGFKIVQFSDLHYGSTIFIDEVKKIVETINNQNADIVVFSGDFFDSNISISDDNLNILIDELNKINASIKTYFVLGNHDYDKLDYIEKFKEKTNWKVLNNTYDYIYTNSNIPIVFVGLDDYWKGAPDYNAAYQYLNDTTKDYYTILLLHEPDQIDYLNTNNEGLNHTFDIAISGHSHLGQVRLPFIGSVFTPYGSKKYYDEHYILEDNKELFISGGLGTSMLKLRFLNKPSINIYRLYTK